MKKPKSAAKLAAEASDKLDQLADREMVAVAELQDRYSALRAEVWRSLTDEAAAKLRGMRETERVGDYAHVRDVMP